MLAAVLAMGTTLSAAPARGATLPEFVGKLTSQVCERMLLGSAAEASALALDVVAQYDNAEARFRAAIARAARASEDASNAQWADILSQVELARRELFAYRIARVAIRACYLLAAEFPRGGAMDTTVVRAAGTWTAVCKHADDGNVATRPRGTFSFSLIGRENVFGSYQEEGGPAGAIAGKWRPASAGFFVDGSASAALGESQGTWRGSLNQDGRGSGDLDVRRAALDLVCSGVWQTN
jgi:hypothetical protein